MPERVHKLPAGVLSPDGETYQLLSSPVVRPILRSQCSGEDFDLVVIRRPIATRSRVGGQHQNGDCCHLERLHFDLPTPGQYTPAGATARAIAGPSRLVGMERRDFLKTAVAATGLKAGGRPLAKRRYRDDVQLSIVGFGGIVVVGAEQKEADRLVAASIDRGVNYFDVAPSYWDGEAETKLGNALLPYRQKVFLACKTMQRDAKGARAELERSLERLHTDRLDLYQFHAVTTLKEVEQILGPGGAAETFVKAREQGKVRYLGCSAHSEAAALAMLDRFPLDSILFPVNFVCFAQGNFGPRIIARAKEKGVARLALKALAHAPLPPGVEQHKSAHPKAWYQPIEDRELASRALRFTLSEDITAAIPPGDEKIFQMALELAADFKPLSKRERALLLAGSKGTAPLFPLA